MSQKRKFHLKDEEPEKKILLGILTEEKDYRLSWLLNKHLGLHLARTDNLRWHFSKLPSDQEFMCYSDVQTKPCKYLLIKNTSAEGLKIPDYKPFDFLLVLSDDRSPTEMKEWLQSLRDLNEIRGVFSLNIQALEKAL